MTRTTEPGGDWRILGGRVSAWYDAPSHAAGAALIGRIAELIGDNDLPDLDLRAGGVRVRFAAGEPTPADLRLAGAISAAARELALAADPGALQTLAFAIDVGGPSARSFWQTTLGYEPTGADCLGDPLRRDPSISSHRLDQPRPLRNRIHVDVVRTAEAVEKARAVIGQDPYGAYGLTLADADGNEIDLVPGDQLSERPEHSDWRTLFGAMTFYPTTSPSQAVDLASAVAGLADEAGLPLLVDLRPEGVTLDSGKDQWEDDEHGTGPRFAALAGRVQAAAHDLGLSADLTRLRFVQFAIDAVDVPAVQGFWRTLLGYQHDPRTFLTDIYDPRRLDPVFMFQALDASDEDRRRQRNRIHFDLVVPSDQVEARIDTALAAGGRLLTDRTAHRRTVADPEGNEITITAGVL